MFTQHCLTYIYRMKKLLSLLFLLFVSTGIFAQLIHPCSETKKFAHSKNTRKHRAGNSDNMLMNKYDVHFYFLDINAERNSTQLSGAVTIGSTITAASLDTFCFELNQSLVIDSIMYNSQSIAFTRIAAITYAILPSPATINDIISVKIFYHGNASVVGAGAIGDGYSTGTSGSWGNQATWSLSEPYSAYEWFPCKQFLQDKADSAWVFVTTDQSNKVASNGLLEGIDSVAGNKLRFRWKTHYMIDYYLISIAVAKYVNYTIYAHPSAMMGDSIPIVNYVYDNPATLTTFKPRIDSIPMTLEYYSDLFGLYPFSEEKYGNCMAPFSGGMEHQTMTSIGNLGSFSTNSHELFHHWFGDHVTCKTWKDIFINEGFASYGEYLAYAQFRSYTAAQNKMANVHDDVLMDPTAMVYFTDTTDVNRIFDSRLTYNKGSAVVHTLRFVMGDSMFFQGLKQFQTTFSFSTASIDDLKNSLETSSGMNLSDYFSQWLYGEGYPTYSAEYASDTNHIFLKVTHTTSSTATPLFKTPLEIKCTSPSGDTTIRIDITQNSNTFMFPSAKKITGLSIDPNNWILNKVGTIKENTSLIPLNLSDIEFENSIEVYPNPTSDNLHIENKLSNETTFSLMSMNGTELLHGNFTNSISIQTRNLSKGVYFIRFSNEHGNTIRKVVKL